VRGGVVAVKARPEGRPRSGPGLDSDHTTVEHNCGTGEGLGEVLLAALDGLGDPGAEVAVAKELVDEGGEDVLSSDAG
jgi:hypothetical protein